MTRPIKIYGISTGICPIQPNTNITPANRLKKKRASGLNFGFKTTIDNRPMLICMERVSNLLIDKIYFKNSPQYHLDLRDLRDVIIRNINIHVNVEQQKALYKEYNLLNEFGFPVFPLNTDGIDPQGFYYYYFNFIFNPDLKYNFF